MPKVHKCVVELHVLVPFDVEEAPNKTTKMLALEVAETIIHGRMQHAHVKIDPDGPDSRELLLDVHMKVGDKK